MPEVNPVRELDAANPHVQFDEREVETEHGRDNVAPLGKPDGKQRTQTLALTTALSLDSTRVSDDDSGHYNPNRSEGPWDRATWVARMAVRD